MKQQPWKILSVFVILLIAVYSTDAIKCYSCNSFDDSVCNSTKLEYERYVEVCDPAKNETRCRKTIQTVYDDTRTIRSCATAGTGDSKCVERIGTAYVKIKYCECIGELCNGSSGIFASVLLLFAIALSNALVNAS